MDWKHLYNFLFVNLALGAEPKSHPCSSLADGVTPVLLKHTAGPPQPAMTMQQPALQQLLQQQQVLQQQHQQLQPQQQQAPLAKVTFSQEASGRPESAVER